VAFRLHVTRIWRRRKRREGEREGGRGAGLTRFGEMSASRSGLPVELWIGGIILIPS